MRRSLVILAVSAGLLSTATGSGAWREGDRADVVRLERLLERMANPAWLATVPQEGERTEQFSSYDRASKLEDGRLVNPFANGDRGHYLRVDTRADGTREHVLAEANGPGYVSRIWSANPAGELRIYVDGSPMPALAADFALITSGKVTPFEPPFGHEASRGCNLYFPFPFSKSIKVVTSEGDQYFQVAVTYLPEGTQVESYSPAVLARVEPELKRVRSELTAAIEVGGQPISPQRAAPGQTIVLAEAAPGRQAIDGLMLKLESDAREEALARALLTITFDGAIEPQVSVPAGDFFGSGPGVNPFRTLMSQVREDGTMAARWFMPFERGYSIKLSNGSSLPIDVSGRLSLTDKLPPGEIMQFHARWAQRDEIETKAGEGTSDWRALAVTGAPGRFVGLLLNVFNPTSAWWGEGDEKVYLDGEAFPSTFGTGTEDYFGYAWCDPHPYMNPFHAQTRCDGPGNRGNTSNVRYQVLDQIPWRESIVFDLEVWHWKAVKVQYATIAYFYAGKSAVIEPAVTAGLSERVVHSGEVAVYREPGAIEAESLRVRRVTAGAVPNQEMSQFGEEWSGASQLWWVCRDPGGVLELELPAVEKAGEYDVVAAFTKAPDYGIARLALDGKPVGQPVDLYDRGVTHGGPMPLGRVELGAGPHLLSLTITGKHAQSTSYLIGMDWLKLVPASR